MKTKKKNKKSILLITGILTLGMIFLLISIFFPWDAINTYQQYNTSTLSYVKGKVVSVDAEDLEKDTQDETRYVGMQTLEVCILEGDMEGETVCVDNYLTRVHNILAEEGQVLILCADFPDNAEPYFTVYQYNRENGLAFLVILFAAAMILVGGRKGVCALLGVCYTLTIVLCFMLQAIYHGFSPIEISVITIISTGGIAVVLINGAGRKTLISFLATILGVFFSAILFGIISEVLHLSGFNTDAAETLVVAADSTGLSIKWLLITGVMISALGAVMDVAVSLTASLAELTEKSPQITDKELHRSGRNIGKAMIGTMSNTLILAFVGTSMNTMLCLKAYGYSVRQLLSSDFLSIEMAEGLCATIGVILTVPITTYIYTYFRKKQDNSHSGKHR